MSTKKVFTKENIKAFSVLVIIAVISAVLLSILSGVLYVSEEEKDQRALMKVYNAPSTKTQINADYANAPKYGVLEGLFKVDDEDVYIFKARGLGGYQNGTMQCYIVLTNTGEIKNITVGENTNQSLATNIKKSYLNNTYVGENILNHDYFNASKLDGDININPVGGATLSSDAVANAVNTVKYYVESTDILEAE